MFMLTVLLRETGAFLKLCGAFPGQMWRFATHAAWEPCRPQGSMLISLPGGAPLQSKPRLITMNKPHGGRTRVFYCYYC